MCIAIVVVVITNLRVVTMHQNKGNQKDIIVREAAVWAFWILFFVVIYLIS